MPVVLGWYNPHSGKMFKDKDKYLKHLKKEARARFEKRKVERFIQSRDQFITMMGNTVKTVPELEQFIQDNWKWFVLNGHFNSGDAKRKDLPRCPELVSIEIKVTKESRVSNSHNCPRNGVTNWGGDNKYKDGTPYPRNYPGWHGKCSFKFKGNCYAGWDIFQGTGICSGSGSGGASSYSFECSLFEDDFPLMTQTYWNNYNWVKLGGKDKLVTV